MHAKGLDVCFRIAGTKWDNASIPMQSSEKSTKDIEKELPFT
jgi:hypothetical protein